TPPSNFTHFNTTKILNGILGIEMCKIGIVT
ncbi:MAG: hypothetical protein ACJA01_002444, partial [Saprospiraceae bacterium]